MNTPRPASPSAGPSQRRPSSRSISLSSSSVVTVKPAAPSQTHAHRPGTPPHSARRRSSAANGAADGIGAFREGVGNLNRWSQSTTSSRASTGPPPSFSRKLSVGSPGTLAAIHGAAQSQSAEPSRLHLARSSTRSPPSSPRRRPRPQEPAEPLSFVPLDAQPAAQPPVLLPATVFDPNSPTSASTANSPSTAGLFTPGIFAASQPTDYFNLKARVAPHPHTHQHQHQPSRSKTERVLGKSPLSSPAILGIQDADSRHAFTLSAVRPRTSSRPAAPRDTGQPPIHGAGHSRRPASRDHSRSASKDHHRSTSIDHHRSESNDHHRSISRDHYRSQSKDHYRSESNTSDIHQGSPPRTRERREKDKKTMLSRALQKANTAVLLDNAQNFEGAMEAYEDACKLLQQVMIRSSQDEDKRKLDAIRVTYTNRIEELRRLDPGYTNSTGKSLPARPMSGESLDEHRSMLLTDDEEPPVVYNATPRLPDERPVADPPVSRPEPETPPAYPLPFRRTDFENPRESVISTAIRDVQRNLPSAQFHLQPPPGRLADQFSASAVESPMDRTYMPPPLSPKRSRSPLFSANRDSDTLEPSRLLQPQPPPQARHQRVHSNESTSWLDTIDESGGSSCSSSVHSLSPSGLRRKHIRNASGATEAEFDAALDAAVEAAYDDGYEPYDEGDMNMPADLITSQLRSAELARERTREAEREEAIAAAKFHYKETQLRNEMLPHVRESAELSFNEEAEEEERLLDEMTREYMLDGFDFDLQTKSSLPRQSDSSGFSGNTYHSSISSHRTTGGTSLSTVAEVMHAANSKPPSTQFPPPVPAPSGALPSVPEFQSAQALDAAEVTPRPLTATKEAASVRSRRLSGQNAKMLKIETSLPAVPPAPQTEKPPVPAKDSPTDVLPGPKSAAAVLGHNSAQSSLDTSFKLPVLPPVSQTATLVAPLLHPALPSPADTTVTVSPATPNVGHPFNESGLAPVPGSPKNGIGAVMGIRKNKSSLSLKPRTLSISSPDGSDASIGTPLSTTFSITGRKHSVAAIPLQTPSLSAAFSIDGPGGGMHLFESDIHSPFSPGSPNVDVANAPIPLEPCPDSYLLRPFWLMRCFYQTIAHPRGGYLSNKLFIPRDVWRVKGVKLKNIEDKIANCDLLTAALQKLAAVDTLDAEAVLGEMQSLESILDQVQAQLVKKLGSEVGSQSISALFKDANTVGDNAASQADAAAGGKGSHASQDHAPKGAVAQGKSYLASWRKLRAKNSGVNLSTAAGGSNSNSTTTNNSSNSTNNNTASATTTKPDPQKDTLVMPSLPMTSLPTMRLAKRDVASVLFDGPNSGYMGSLARLFDAVQILDQIARQVEDPGLKFSSTTHIGLEFSARHAATFFGFYICRFVLADVTLLLDKFIKRGSEWVLV
ncbi:hypothetical protein P153DRAFT_419296 [Dothidotthia symphoricarpi CBS 119687]|uniref:MIT domain-containing protein n=1 Tax=Dothidotthia symphoricarpi CBS 119687 TaxID=1392245 RepID=A0A6A6AUN2_9PLEO|nr:uncharacterized protein P153DRAFT_419296 [Dothidotthia symphoricarpi CBS 119687]KAF2134644.1 hypothetical protein P153DRAFT_419296 [Dothidotthia symphoricarpi CBS 119687]